MGAVSRPEVRRGSGRGRGEVSGGGGSFQKKGGNGSWLRDWSRDVCSPFVSTLENWCCTTGGSAQDGCFPAAVLRVVREWMLPASPCHTARFSERRRPEQE